MYRQARLILFLVFVAFVVFSWLRGSDNTGKIEGRWKVVAKRADTDDQRVAAENLMARADTVFTFRDGKLELTAVRTIDGKAETALVMSANYRLGFLDSVSLSEIQPPDAKGGTRGRLKVRIEGETMTISNTGGPQLVLTRVP